MSDFTSQRPPGGPGPSPLPTRLGQSSRTPHVNTINRPGSSQEQSFANATNESIVLRARGIPVNVFAPATDRARGDTHPDHHLHVVVDTSPHRLHQTQPAARRWDRRHYNTYHHQPSVGNNSNVHRHHGHNGGQAGRHLQQHVYPSSGWSRGGVGAVAGSSFGYVGRYEGGSSDGSMSRGLGGAHHPASLCITPQMLPLPASTATTITTTKRFFTLM